MEKNLLEELMALSPEERSALQNRALKRYLLGVGLSIAGGYAVAKLIQFGLKKAMPIDLLDNNL